jgi:hypothetical protein
VVRGAVGVGASPARRQALGAIRGYAYQLYATAGAGLNLRDDGKLLVEVAEEYATLAADVLQATRIRDNPSATTTLRSPGVSDTLNAFWALEQANPGVTVRSVYLTTSCIGREQALWFPGERWVPAPADGVDLAPDCPKLAGDDDTGM